MHRHPAEVFGLPISAKGAKAQRARDNYYCPFRDAECNKQTRLADHPMAVCSVQYGDDVVALCPNRFLQDDVVFKDIADHYFQSRNNLLVFPEVGLSGVGNFDFVMVKHKAFSSDIEDFVVIELQTAQTTSTGKLVQALKDFLEGEEVKGKNYGFGLNLADIWKRSFTQILNKGMVTEAWGHKIYWVVQELVYRDFVSRYGLHAMGYDDGEHTVFWIYDLVRRRGRYAMIHTREESSTMDALFKAYRENRDIPSKDEFLDKIQSKIARKVQLDLKLG